MTAWELCRQPRAEMFLHGKRLFVMQRPDPMVPLAPMSFGDPGDEQP